MTFFEYQTKKTYGKTIQKIFKKKYPKTKKSSKKKGNP